MKLTKMVFAAALVALIFPATASAQVPGDVPIQAFLTDDSGVPVDGTVTVTFSIYDSASGGTALHTEEQTLDADAGAFTAYLQPDLEIFNTQDDLYLALAVDGGAEMSPRLKLATVPYAAIAGNASTLQGMTADDFAASDYQPSWDDITDVPDDIGTTYGAGSGVEIDGNDTISLNSGCATDQLLKWDGTDWTCQDDEDSTLTAGTGLTLNNDEIAVDPSTVQSRVSGSCSAGEYVMGINQDGTVVCGTDQDTDTNTTYSAASGLNLSGTAFSVDTSTIQSRVSGTCGAGEYVMEVNADGTVVCGTDQDTDTQYTAGTGLALNNEQFSVASGGITSNEIADGTIANADISGSASIAGSKLESDPTFNGTATASNFDYDAAKRRYLTVGPADFTLTDSQEDDRWRRSALGYGYISNDGGDGFARATLTAPVELSGGAEITDVYCYAYDNASGDNMSLGVSLYRQRLYANAPAARDTLASVSINTSGTSTDLDSGWENSISNALVDDQYSYWMYLDFNPDIASSSLRFYGCKLYYDATGPSQ